MATFKVNQRVRLVAAAPDTQLTARFAVPVGTQGVVIRDIRFFRPRNATAPLWGYTVAFDGLSSPRGNGWYFCAPHQLVPLTDPGAEKFVADLLKLVREPLPLDTNQLKEIRS